MLYKFPLLIISSFFFTITLGQRSFTACLGQRSFTACGWLGIEHQVMFTNYSIIFAFIWASLKINKIFFILNLLCLTLVAGEQWGILFWPQTWACTNCVSFLVSCSTECCHAWQKMFAIAEEIFEHINNVYIWVIYNWAIQRSWFAKVNALCNFSKLSKFKLSTIY